MDAFFLHKFLDFLRFERKASEHTIISYSNDLRGFISFLLEEYDCKCVADTTHQHIRAWLSGMMGQGISPKSVSRKISSLKAYYKYLQKHGLHLYNPMSKVISPKQPKLLPQFVEQHKMQNLLNNISCETEKSYAIVLLLYYTGMRVSELLKIKKTDIDYGNCSLKVHGKRNKERIIPFNEELQKNLYKLQEHSKGEYLIEAPRGGRAYPKYVYRLVKDSLSAVTTQSKKSPHILRHTFATHMLENGAELNAIKELLGHANLAATQVYTHNTIERLKSIHKKSHPKSKQHED